jgi:hypothetical protein
MALPHKHLGRKRRNSPSFQASGTGTVEPEFGVANEPINVQVAFKKRVAERPRPISSKYSRVK